MSIRRQIEPSSSGMLNKATGRDAASRLNEVLVTWSRFFTASDGIVSFRSIASMDFHLFSTTTPSHPLEPNHFY